VLESLKLNMKSKILAHEQTIIQKEDVEDHHATSKEQIQELLEQKQTLQAELENATDYILELEEKVYKANKTSLELLKQLKDAEVEIETLKQYIIDLKQRIAVYIPVKEDSTDKKLAEFINNYPERSKLKIMFMRETEGVYQFGTKRVSVKVEKDNIKIRVGGGYLSIDEFLDQYTPVELEKLERKDPLRRFSEKVAIQKTIVNAGVRESSPVRSPGRVASPLMRSKQAV
jgi:DNA repair exonuclease SbcCD ATPase subunit